MMNLFFPRKRRKVKKSTKVARVKQAARRLGLKVTGRAKRRKPRYSRY